MMIICNNIDDNNNNNNNNNKAMAQATATPSPSGTGARRTDPSAATSSGSCPPAIGKGQMGSAFMGSLQ